MFVRVFASALGAVVLAPLVVLLGLAGMLRAQEAPAAQRVLPDPSVARFFTPASGALFALSPDPWKSAEPVSLLRSDDGGATWRAVALPALAPDARGAVAVDPRDHTVVYAMGEGGLYKSDDDAASWRLVLPIPSPADAMVDIAVSPADTGVVYVVLQPRTNAQFRILRSRDGGGSWEETFSGRCFRATLFPHPADADRIFATLGCGPDLPNAVYLSRDQAVTWSAVAPWPMEDPGYGGWAEARLAGGADWPERLYLAFVRHSFEDGIPLYRSDDSGETWERQILGARREIYPGPKWQGGKMWSHVTWLDRDPTDPERVYASLTGAPDLVRASADGGATWAAIPLPGGLRNATALALGVDRRNLYVATASGSAGGDQAGVYRVPLDAP